MHMNFHSEYGTHKPMLCIMQSRACTDFYDFLLIWKNVPRLFFFECQLDSALITPRCPYYFLPYCKSGTDFEKTVIIATVENFWNMLFPLSPEAFSRPRPRRYKLHWDFTFLYKTPCNAFFKPWTIDLSLSTQALEICEGDENVLSHPYTFLFVCIPEIPTRFCDSDKCLHAPAL